LFKLAETKFLRFYFEYNIISIINRMIQKSQKIIIKPAEYSLPMIPMEIPDYSKDSPEMIEYKTNHYNEYMRQRYPAFAEYFKD